MAMVSNVQPCVSGACSPPVSASTTLLAKHRLPDSQVTVDLGGPTQATDLREIDVRMRGCLVGWRRCICLNMPKPAVGQTQLTIIHSSCVERELFLVLLFV